jgi:hypothetical protein
LAIDKVERGTETTRDVKTSANSMNNSIFILPAQDGPLLSPRVPDWRFIFCRLNVVVNQSGRMFRHPSRNYSDIAHLQRGGATVRCIQKVADESAIPNLISLFLGRCHPLCVDTLFRAFFPFTSPFKILVR